MSLSFFTQVDSGFWVFLVAFTELFSFVCCDTQVGMISFRFRFVFVYFSFIKRKCETKTKTKTKTKRKRKRKRKRKYKNSHVKSDKRETC